nr:MAG TPA: hypothetical protein [Caudoviricetes sp.]
MFSFSLFIFPSIYLLFIEFKFIFNFLLHLYFINVIIK